MPEVQLQTFYPYKVIVCSYSHITPQTTHDNDACPKCLNARFRHFRPTVTRWLGGAAFDQDQDQDLQMERTLVPPPLHPPSRHRGDVPGTLLWAARHPRSRRRGRRPGNPSDIEATCRQPFLTAGRRSRNCALGRPGARAAGGRSAGQRGRSRRPCFVERWDRRSKLGNNASHGTNATEGY